MSEQDQELIIYKLDELFKTVTKMNNKLDKVHKCIFETNGDEALVTQVHRNAKFSEENYTALRKLAVRESGKALRYLILAGKAAAASTAIITFIVAAAFCITKIAKLVG